MDLKSAVVYDIETFPNVFTLNLEWLFEDQNITYEISTRRDDRAELLATFDWLRQCQIPMIGFNNLGFDYPVIHFLYQNRFATIADLYIKAMSIIKSADRFGHMIWPNERFAPQVDLFKIHHFDNRAKTTSLKALQVNMRAQTVVESAVPFGALVSDCDIDGSLIPYNVHDVRQTKQFAHYSLPAMEFRASLVDQFGPDVMNYNDTKIGEKMLEQRIGEDICYDRSSGRKEPRQTYRSQIALRDIIFPYVQFSNPEFQRIHRFMLEQTLKPDDLDMSDQPVIITKGVFTDLHATVGGLTFHFGTGGVHASVDAQVIHATDEWLIRDIDVAALYPSIAIVNNLAPAHLGEAFVQPYSRIPLERKQHAKGTYMNAALKLAANGAWGKSNSKFSAFYDPQYAMTIPINGQLLICMLVEQLVDVPSLNLIQVNTDGVTYRVHRDFEPLAAAVCRAWEQITRLTLEDADYRSMWIRDVNNYVAETLDGKFKLKGAYWTPDADPAKYADSISNASPPSWHKDLSNLVSIRAAVAAMTKGIDPEQFIRQHSDPFDFMCRAKASGGAYLLHGDRRVQSTFRYYVSTDGAPLVKMQPPSGGHVVGEWKRAPKITKAEYDRVMRETGGEWDERVCTKAKSRYEVQKIGIESGWLVRDVCDASEFSFGDVDYAWYVAEARKLIIT